MSQPRFQSAKNSPSNPIKHIAKTPGKGQRGTAQELLIIYRHKGPYVKGKILILDVQTRPRYDFSNALQTHNTNDKLIKTTC